MDGKSGGTLHWLSRHNAVDAEVRLYDHLITLEDVGQVEEGKDFLDYMNPESEVVRCRCRKLSRHWRMPKGRTGSNSSGTVISAPMGADHVPGEKPVFNRIVGLRDSWAKIAKKGV